MSNNTMFDGAHPALAAFLAVLLAVAAIGAVSAPAAAAGGVSPQTDDAVGNQTVETTDSGLTLEQLKEPGVSIPEAPPSARSLGDAGVIAIRHNPVDPLSPANAYLEPGTELNGNTLTLQSIRFGAGVEPVDATVHTAFYQTETRPVTNEQGQQVSEETVATDVHVQKTNVTLQSGYDSSEIKLAPHFDETYNMAMWVTDSDGDQLGSARWTTGLTHRSSEAAAPVDIDNQSDLFGFIAVNILLVGVGGLLAGFGAGKHVLNKIGRGTGLGVGAYGILFGVIAFLLVLFAYVETAAVIANVPAIWGGIIALVGFVGYVETAGPNDRRVLFERDELTEARSASGEEVVDAVYEDIEDKLAIYREDGSIGLPKNGIRPAFARYFAEPASLEDIDLSTSIDLNGDFDEKYVADPDSDEVLVHTPAHLEWNPQVIADPTDPENPESLFDRLNYSFIAASVVLVGGGWYAASEAIGYGSVGVVAGLLGVIALGYKAVDGRAEFEPAPIHMRPAKATIKNTAIEYDDAKTIEDADRRAYQAEATSAAEIRRRQSEQSRVTSRKLMEESTGVSLSESDGPAAKTPVEHPEGRKERRGGKPTQNGTADNADDEDEDTDGGVWRDA